MAKKKEVKKESKVLKIDSYESAKAHVKSIGVKTDGFDECFVCEDGNVFTDEGACTYHARNVEKPYYKVEL